MFFEMKMAKGDITQKRKVPWPLADQDGHIIGMIHSLHFDGEYTMGRIELTSEAEKNRLLKRIEEDNLRSQKLKEEYFKAFRGGH